MIRLPEWLSPRPSRLSARNTEPDAVTGAPDGARAPAFAWAMNTDGAVIDLVRPHLRTSCCTIVTGYQDFFSSLSIVMREVPELTCDDGTTIRIAFGMNTANADRISGRGRSVPEAARQHFLGKHGLSVDDAADLGAVLAIDAIRAGRIDLRLFDPDRAADLLEVSGARRLHAKIVASPRGAIAGSANFSRAGLYQNIEYVDAADAAVDDPVAAAVAKDRQHAAETIWNASTDWNAEALEILEALLRPVTPEDAVARTLHEQTSFVPWRVDRQADIAGRAALPHQAELVYEASSIVYEHGVAFLEAPPGSGKTDIGKHLGHTLATSFERIFGQDHTGRLPRGGALAIVPPRVEAGWTRRRPRVLDVARNTTIASRRQDLAPPAGPDGARDLSRTAEALERAPEVDLTQYGTLIIDESHTITPGFDENSRRAEAVEFAPPCWNVCLSATLLGNRDVDWLAHLHEKRASIFMSPQYLAEMNALFRREAGIEQLMRYETDAEALSAPARAALADMLSPFMAIRRRACIGESAIRDPACAAHYPPFEIHPRPRALHPSARTSAAIDEIARLAGDLAPGRRLASVNTSRFGTRAQRPHRESRLWARNLLNILRANSAQALWEMQHGAIGRALRRFEAEATRKRRKAAQASEAQLSLFDNLPEELPKGTATPICDRLAAHLARPAIQRLDSARYAEALRIQRRHRRVVFLAERIDTLEIFAASLARRHGPDDTHAQYVATSEESDAGGGKARRRARRDILGDAPPGFETIRQGHLIETFFRPGGPRNAGAPASIFLTYQMAEGINLQSADALVLLGITSNLKDLLQGMGRIDRIDSAHAMTHYYLLDVPVTAIASDEKVARRLETYRALSGRERIETAEDAGGDTQLILDSVAAYLREPRPLRTNNYHDLLAGVRAQVDPARYALIAGTEIQGLWGAELAVLKSARPFTLLHLRGESGTGGTFAPPRLLLIEPDGTLVRNQVRCAQRLKAAFDETRAQGLATAPPNRLRMQDALAELGTRVHGIREWQLAPERTESLLQSLAVFLSGTGDGMLDLPAEADPEESLFGHLGLRGIEYLCETWARLLDPYWVGAKQQVRENFARKAAQSYISIADMTDRLQADMEKRDRIRATMLAALAEAERIEAPRADAVTRRISVAFVSLPAPIH